MNKIEKIKKALEDKFDVDVILSLDQDGEALHLDMIKVPDYLRGKGIGTRVMRKLISLAKKANFPAITLHAYPKAEREDGATGEEIKNLMEWYMRFGFFPVFPYYDEVLEDDEYYVYQVSPFQSPLEECEMVLEFDESLAPGWAKT